MDPGLPTIVAVLWPLPEPIRLQYKQPNDTQHAPLLPLRVRYARLVLERAGLLDAAQLLIQSLILFNYSFIRSFS